MSAWGIAPKRRRRVLAASVLLRAVVDTNVWISGLLSAANPASPTRQLVRAYIERRFTAVASRELLSELAEVVARPRLSIRASTWVTDASALLGLIGREPLIQITNASYGCRDPKDDAVIETAILGQVQYLVTGDQDLLDPIVVVTLNANGILLTTARALVAKITI